MRHQAEASLQRLRANRPFAYLLVNQPAGAWLYPVNTYHASICFMALVLNRVMRQRLKLAGSTLSPEAALRQLRRIQRHQVRIDDAAPIAGISTIHADQADTLAALHVKKPSLDAQMSLL